MYDHRRLFVRITETLDRRPGASLASIAQALHVDPHTVAAVIQEHAGASFTEWRTARRAALSCTLLRTRPELSIKEVAAAAGFGSTSAFDRFLRRTCGRSPSECRLAVDGADLPAGRCGLLVAPRRDPAATAGQRIGDSINVPPDPT